MSHDDHEAEHEHGVEPDGEREPEQESASPHGGEGRSGGNTPHGRITRAAWRFGGPWAAVTGIIATSSVCPYCGNPGCAVGIGQAAGIGAVTSGVLWVINHFRSAKQEDADSEQPALAEAPDESSG